MNKTKLEVIRINEDVIATSATGPKVCNLHPDKNHGYAYEFNAPDMVMYYYTSGNITRGEDACANVSSQVPNVTYNDPNALNKWYYEDSNLKWYVCNGDHSGYVLKN